VEARGLTIESSGHLVVGDTTEAGPSLFRVDPSNGARTVLTEFEESRESFANLNDVATDFAGNILVIGYAAQSFRSLGRLFRVDAATGAYVLVAERPCGSSVAMNMAVEDTGNIIMIVGDDTAQRLARFDPGAGACTRVFLAGWISDVAVVPTPSVNDAVSLSVAGTVLDAVGAPHAPAGVFRIAATFTNLTSLAIRNPFFRVAELSGGNLLVSGDRPPDQGMAGKGARQTPDVGLDGLLSPGESIVVEFGIGLQSRQAFTFLVDVFGEIDSSGSK
jgi:hypothetical protein